MKQPTMYNHSSMYHPCQQNTYLGSFYCWEKPMRTNDERAREGICFKDIFSNQPTLPTVPHRQHHHPLPPHKSINRSIDRDFTNPHVHTDIETLHTIIKNIILRCHILLLLLRDPSWHPQFDLLHIWSDRSKNDYTRSCVTLTRSNITTCSILSNNQPTNQRAIIRFNPPTPTRKQFYLLLSIWWNW